jgi:hypothetical protein
MHLDALVAGQFATSQSLALAALASSGRSSASASTACSARERWSAPARAPRTAPRRGAAAPGRSRSRARTACARAGRPWCARRLPGTGRAAPRRADGGDIEAALQAGQAHPASPSGRPPPAARSEVRAAHCRAVDHVAALHASPALSAGTRNALRPVASPGAPALRATTIKASALAASSTRRFSPLSTQASPSRRRAASTLSGANCAPSCSARLTLRSPRRSPAATRSSGLRRPAGSSAVAPSST